LNKAIINLKKSRVPSEIKKIIFGPLSNQRAANAAFSEDLAAAKRVIDEDNVIINNLEIDHLGLIAKEMQQQMTTVKFKAVSRSLKNPLSK